MERIYSTLPKKAYLASLKSKCDSPFRMFDERVTGVVLGPFFSVAHYQSWEWNRKITAECNRAFGYVTETEEGTKVTFLRSKGMLSPFWMLLLTGMMMVCYSLMLPMEAIREELGKMLGMAVTISLVVCGVTALQHCFTEAGIAGAGEITKLLKDPDNYYC